MQPFRKHTGLVAPLDRPNVDTDAIVPKQFLKRIERTGFGQFLFDSWRRKPDGSPIPDFVLNRPEYQGATVLLARDNFGCGSSREHAPWAILDYGFRTVLAPSFADIFHNNCFKNGVLPVTLSAAEIDDLFRRSDVGPVMLTIDLETNSVVGSGAADGFSASFAVDPFRRECLLNGWDDIGLTLRHEAAIADYEGRARVRG